MTKPQRSLGKKNSAFLATVILLGAALAIEVSQANQVSNQFSTLKESGRSYCHNVNDAASATLGIFLNTIKILGQQIANDSSMSAMLNSTRPAGYEGMVATLDSQISQDKALTASMSVLTGTGQSTNFCAFVNR